MKGPESGIEAWNSLDEYIRDMDNVDDKTAACRESLAGLPWPDLQQLGGMVDDVDMSDTPSKVEVRHRLADEHVFVGGIGSNLVYREQNGEIERLAELETMSDSNSDTADESNSLDDQPYGDLMNVARSAREQFDEVDIDTNAPKKGELIEAMDEQGVEKTDDGWEVDGEAVDLLEVQTPDEYSNGGSSGPSDKTVLYCLTRAATTDDRVEQISDALEAETDFELQEAGNGDKFSIVLPAEAQEGYEEPSEDDEDEESDESDETAESGAESDESDEEAAEQEEDEESAESESDGADESEDEIDEGPPEAIARTTYEETLNDKNKTEVYQTATELDVDGRSDMTKKELIEAVAGARVQDDDSPVVPDEELMADA